jgi:hypothetical protein
MFPGKGQPVSARRFGRAALAAEGALMYTFEDFRG